MDNNQNDNNQNDSNWNNLAALAHKALNRKGTEYARNKTRIAQFFDTACAPANKEEVRLTLIDSLYSANVEARRLFGISHIAGQLCKTFPYGDDQVKAEAKKWIAKDFDDENPLYAVFAAKYGCNKEGKETKTAPALVSKYLYFVTGCAFPIYNDLGAKYYYLIDKQAPRRPSKDAQERFRIMKKILLKNKIKDFDHLDAFFWLYGKVQEANFSSALNKARYTELASYKGKKTIEAVVNEIRRGILSVKNADTLRDILGADLYAFIQQTAGLD